MWILLFISVLMAAANDRGWAYSIRLELGGLHINFFLMVMLVGFGAAFVSQRTTTLRRLPKNQLYRSTLFFLITAAIVGIFGTAFNDAGLFLIIDTGFAIRDFLVLPMGIYIGYQLCNGPNAGKNFCKVVVAAGVAVSILGLLYFRAAAANVTDDSNINSIRTIAYLTDYAGLACAILLYACLSGNNLFGFWIDLLLAGFCLLGQIAPLNRSSWVACAAGICSVFLIIPRGKRLRGAGVTIVLGAVLAGALFVGDRFASQWTHWNFGEKIVVRLNSLIPGSETDGPKAWDSRTTGTMEELDEWASNPLFGRGFGIQESQGFTDDDGIHHDAWTDTLAKMGLIGLVPICLITFGALVVGKRMIAAGGSQSYVLAGGMGFIFGAYYILLGLCTWSFNSFRGGACLAIAFGVLMRCRSEQLQEFPQIAAAPELDQYSLRGEPV